MKNKIKLLAILGLTGGISSLSIPVMAAVRLPMIGDNFGCVVSDSPKGAFYSDTMRYCRQGALSDSEPTQPFIWVLGAGMFATIVAAALLDREETVGVRKADKLLREAFNAPGAIDDRILMARLGVAPPPKFTCN